MDIRRLLITYILLNLSIFKTEAQVYDVVVYGASASGVISAIAASNEGAKVLIVEPRKNVGGMVTGGLSHTDYGDRTVIGGLTFQFYQKVADHYDTHVFFWRGPEPLCRIIFIGL